MREAAKNKPISGAEYRDSRGLWRKPGLRGAFKTRARLREAAKTKKAAQPSKPSNRLHSAFDAIAAELPGNWRWTVHPERPARWQWRAVWSGDEMDYLALADALDSLAMDRRVAILRGAFLQLSVVVTDPDEGEIRPESTGGWFLSLSGLAADETVLAFEQGADRSRELGSSYRASIITSMHLWGSISGH